MQNVMQDLRYGLRTIVRRPGFTLVAVLTLALGIAANTAIFSVVNTVLLKPLPFPHSENIIDIAETFKPDGWGTVSVPNLEDWHAQNDVFENLAAYSSTSFNLQQGDTPERISGLNVTANYFDALAVRPQLGRAFLAGEDVAGREQVVILSDDLWRRSFNADPQILNHTIPLNGQRYTVIGVMPPALSSLYSSVQMWSPLVFSESDRQDRDNHKYFVLGRIKEGRTLAQARDQMNGIAARLESQFHNGRGVRLTQLQELRVASVRPALILLLVAVGFVLLIACTNVANLLLARATVRHREISIRIALGAGRFRLIQQFLTEGLLLSFIGGALGIALAWLSLDLLGQLAFPFLPRAQEINIDSRVLLFTVFISILTSVVFGLVPALQSRSGDVQDALKEGSNTVSAGMVSSWLRQLLVVIEIAAAFVLLIGAGLMIRSVLQLRQVEPGFKSQNLLTAKLSLPREKYTDTDSTIRFYNQVLDRVKVLPGVEAAAFVSHLPVEEQGYNGNIQVVGKTYPANESPLVEFRTVSPDFLQAAGIPLLRGRFFTAADRANSQLVVVINNSMAKRIWGDEDPIGKVISDRANAVVVGVIGDIKNYGLLRKPVAEMYVPLAQNNLWPDMLWNMRLMVRSIADETNLTAAVRREVQAVDPAQPIYGVESMTVALENTVRDKSLNMTLLAVFAGISLLLAVIGVYGVMSYSVAQHTREIGIRMALGAAPRTILKLIMGRGLFLIALGVGIGVVASFGLTRFIQNLLFGVTPTDPLTFVMIVLLLTLVALLACLIPAQRAMRVDPIVVLRYE